MIRATNRFFLAGINHMFFHGTCYSPADAEWPGWLFYASTQVNNRNPLWRELPTLFKYIERSQSILQNSRPINDVLIYWPYYDVAASEGRIFNHLGVNKDAGWFKSHPISGLSEQLTKAGYSFDYVSDKQLLNCMYENGEIISEGKTTYQAIVVPETKYIPVETLKQMQHLISAGGKVYFDKQLPESVPGMFNLEEREKQLSEIKVEITEENCVGNPIELLGLNEINGEESISAVGFHYLKMKMNDEDYYMICNTGLEQKDEWVELQSKGKSAVVLNPMNGEISNAEKRGNKVRIQLDPEQLVFLAMTRNKNEASDYLYESSDAMGEMEVGLWKIEFLEGGPEIPANLQTENLVSWTTLGDEETKRFAGTAKYTLEFTSDLKSENAILDLGVIKDCAHVYLNGKDFGAVLGPVFKIKVNNLQQGTNKLEVEVTNVAANRIRDLDISGVNWKKFYDINFVNIDYEPFDASGWKILDAGLLGPVTIVAL